MANDNEKNLQEGQLEGGLERKVTTKELEGLISSFIRNRVFKNVLTEQLKVTTGKGDWYISAYFRFEGVGDLALSAEIKNLSDSEVGWSRFQVSAKKDLRDLIEIGRPSPHSLIETAYGGRRIESLNIEGQELVAKFAPETLSTSDSTEKNDSSESSIEDGADKSIKELLGPEFKSGQDIKVKRSDGIIEDDWKLTRSIGGIIIVTKASATGGILSKGVTKEEFLELNSTQSESLDASVPLMITRDMEQQLADLGYTKGERAKLIPQEAWEIIQKGEKKSKPENLEAQPPSEEHLSPEERIQKNLGNPFRLGVDIVVRSGKYRETEETGFKLEDVVEINGVRYVLAKRENGPRAPQGIESVRIPMNEFFEWNGSEPKEQINLTDDTQKDVQIPEVITVLEPSPVATQEIRDLDLSHWQKGMPVKWKNRKGEIFSDAVYEGLGDSGWIVIKKGNSTFEVAPEEFLELNPQTTDVVDVAEQIDADIANQVLKENPELADLINKTPEEVEKIEQHWAVKLWNGGFSKIKDKSSKIYNFIKEETSDLWRGFAGKKREKAQAEIVGEAERIEQELKPEEKFSIFRGLATVGYKVQEWKGRSMAAILEKVGGEQKDEAEMKRLSFLRDASIKNYKATAARAQKQQEELFTAGGLISGGTKKAIGVGTFAGNALLYYRVFTDTFGGLIGKGLTQLSPLRNFTAGAMLLGRTAAISKEAELNMLAMETRMKDMEEAHAAAMELYEKAKNESKDAKVSREDLEKAYVMELPEEVLQKMQTLSANAGFFRYLPQVAAAWGIKKSLESSVKRLKSIEEFKSDTYTEEFRQNDRDKLLLNQAKFLKEMELMVGEGGAISLWAYASRVLEIAGKTTATALALETLASGAITVSESLEKHLKGLADYLVHGSDEAFENSKLRVEGLGGLAKAHEATFEPVEAEPIHEKIFENFEVVGVGEGLKLEDVFAKALAEEGYDYRDHDDVARGAARVLVSRLASLSPSELQGLGISSGNPHLLTPGDKIDINKLVEKSLELGLDGKGGKDELASILETEKEAVLTDMFHRSQKTDNFKEYSVKESGEKIQIGEDKTERIMTRETQDEKKLKTTDDANTRVEELKKTAATSATVVPRVESETAISETAASKVIEEREFTRKETEEFDRTQKLYKGGQLKTGLPAVTSAPVEPTPTKTWEMPKATPVEAPAAPKVDLTKTIFENKNKELAEEFYRREQANKFELDEKEAVKVPFKKVETIVARPEATVVESAPIKGPIQTEPVVPKPPVAAASPSEKMVDVSAKDPELYSGQVLVPEKENVFADEPAVAPKTEITPESKEVPLSERPPRMRRFPEVPEKNIPSAAPVFTDAQMAKLMEDVEDEVKSDIKEIYHITWIDKWGAKDWEEARVISAKQFLKTFSGHKIEDKNVFLEGSKDKHAKLFKHFEGLMNKTGLAPKETETVEDFLKRLTLEEKKIMNAPLSKVIPTGGVENIPPSTRDFSQFKPAGVKIDEPVKNIAEPQAPSAPVQSTQELDEAEFDRKAAVARGIDISNVPPEGVETEEALPKVKPLVSETAEEPLARVVPLQPENTEEPLPKVKRLKENESESLSKVTPKDTPVNDFKKDGPYDMSTSEEQQLLEQVRREIASIAVPKEPTPEDFAYDLNQKIVRSEALEEAVGLGLERELDAMSTGAIKTELNEIYGENRAFGLFGRTTGENSQYWKHVKDTNIKKFEDFYNRFGKESAGLSPFNKKENEKQFKLFQLIQKLRAESGTEPLLTETVGGYVHRAMKEALAKAHHLKR